MSDFKCFACDGALVSDGGNKYFTYFICELCGKYFCLANDGCDTWSWLKRSKLGKPQFWVGCKDAMHKKNPIIEKVIFT